MIPAVERAAKKRSKMNHFQFPLDQKTIRRRIGFSASDSGGIASRAATVGQHPLTKAN